MARTRTTKKLAQRIDLNYFKRPTPLKRAKLGLSILIPALALVWMAWLILARNTSVYSSGRMAEAHAVLTNDCAACHVQKAGVFAQKAEDSACLSCHDGPIHHHVAVKQVACAQCHNEHRGRVNLLAASNQNCSQCHSDLRANGGTSNYANAIFSFDDGHPEFAAVRSEGGGKRTDPGTIKLNHALHMKLIRRGPTGPMVQLGCGNCHRPAAAPADLTYGDAKYHAATTSYKMSDEILPSHQESLPPHDMSSGRALMAPVKFATACASCHLLTFDKHFDEGVPHDKPDVVHAFLVTKFTQYIAAHPGDVRVVRDPNRDLTERVPQQPEVRILTPAQWVAERTADAEQLLWRKTCIQCHSLSVAGAAVVPAVATAPSVLPVVAPANTTVNWMPHAKFDHEAHTGFTCVSCHTQALTSTLTTDVLMPGIATCKTCHAPGPDHAESRCFECHTYHDWAKRKEISPTFNLPALKLGGR